MYSTSVIEKLRWSLPWLSRYPFWRLAEMKNRAASGVDVEHLIFIVANHFEPGVGPEGLSLLEKWYELARTTGEAIRDHDGTKFRHTNYKCKEHQRSNDHRDQAQKNVR